MLKNMVIAVLVAVFVFAGAAVVMAGDSDSSCDKNAMQSMYDWFAGCGNKTANSTECVCRTCKKACCEKCNENCGGKCCADCGKK